MSRRDSQLLEAIAQKDLFQIETLLESEPFTAKALERAFKDAGMSGDVPTLELLWKRARPRTERHGEVALRAASSQGHEEATQFLLDHGVSPEARVPVGAPATSFVETGTRNVHKHDESVAASVWPYAIVLVVLLALIVFVIYGRGSA